MRRNYFCVITYCLLAYAMLFQTHVTSADQTSNHLINIKDLGAIGDGNADDTQAIQEALNLVNANGSEILMSICRIWRLKFILQYLFRVY